MADMSRTNLPNICSWPKHFISWFKRRLGLFMKVYLPIDPHWFSEWFGSYQKQKLLPEPMLTQFTHIHAYMAQQASRG